MKHKQLQDFKIIRVTIVLLAIITCIIFNKQWAFAKNTTLYPYLGGRLIQATDPGQEFEGKAVLGLLSARGNKNDSLQDISGLVKPAIVRLHTGNLTGSGIIISLERDRALIASNKHQLSPSLYSEVTLFSGKKLKGIRSYLSDSYDLGFLEVDLSPLSFEERLDLRTIYYDDKITCKKGDFMFVIGSADGVAANVFEGIVADPMYYFPEFGSHMVYGHCRAKAGMSGGGAFNREGCCIGMITGGIDDETASLPIAFIFDEVKQFYGKETEQ